MIHVQSIQKIYKRNPQEEADNLLNLILHYSPVADFVVMMMAGTKTIKQL
jgi:hypothetical protein